MVSVQAMDVQLTCQRGGELVPWIGPAFRGIVARRFKNLLCLHPPTLRDTRWIRCQGCPYHDHCVYGLALETPAHPDLIERFGTDGARTLVMAPQFPAPSHLRLGQTLPIRMTWFNPPADGWQKLRQAISQAMIQEGIGPDHVRCSINEGSLHSVTVDSSTLPRSASDASAPGVQAAVQLVGPLFLASRDPDQRRRPLINPSFHDLFRASVRTLRQLFGQSGMDLELDWDSLHQAALQARTLRSNLRVFEQRKWSNRTQERFNMQGVTGSIEFTDVHPALLPWLQWGGIVHVGTHRVAGAGAWQLYARSPD